MVNDFIGSDYEVYSGLFVLEEINYDEWDGFGDEFGWFGKFLGFIND